MKKFNKVCQCGCEKSFETTYEISRFIRGHYRKFQVGDKAPGWKGGVVYKRGYVFIYNPNHPSADQEYVKRSRLTMENKLGRILKPFEFIHHINGVKDDDRIENLFLTTLSEHNSIHKRKEVRQRDKHGRLLPN
jgi:hypothetical protein